MKTDITGRKDLEALINKFYDRVIADEVIGHFFRHVNWEKHLPLMYDFWENAIFYTGGYTGNPMHIHQAFHKRSPLSPEHFKQWIHIFLLTVDELFEGSKSELIKQRALSISTVMQIKILQQP